MAWPAHATEPRAWSPGQRAGNRADRTLAQIAVSIPPIIAGEALQLDPAVVVEMETALAEIVALDKSHGEHLDALGPLLLRTESVASSKIEDIEASVEDYARALHGSRANVSAISMVAATTALQSLLADLGPGKPITLKAVLAAHHALMVDDAYERRYAGQWRDVQNWIGGSDYSPRNALYIPPPPDMVGPYMADLVAFADRDDIPVLAQAAIAHAQFESIHPFTDGNGRIGRALINAILRRRGTTTRVVVPLASALVAHRDRYFDLLDSYRAGHTEPLISAFAVASRLSAAESRVSAQRLADIPRQWADRVGQVRSGSAAAKLLATLPTRPILTADDAVAAVGGSVSSVYAAIERLREADVLKPLTTRKRDQVWGAGLVLDELDDLSARIGRAAR